MTELSPAYQLIPGTGFYMPPCTLHAPGSLVTYELPVAFDVTCIPESRVNDLVMPSDLLDRDIPVSVKDGAENVCEYILDMIRCPNSGNSDDFYAQYFRPPVKCIESENGEQAFVIYRCVRISKAANPDFYSAKRTIVKSGARFSLSEKCAFGTVVLGGHGTIGQAGKEAIPLESASMFLSRESVGGDEIFVAAMAKII